MKVFLITWGLFCFLVIVGLFIAYGTDQLSSVPVAQSRSKDPDKSGQVKLQVKDVRNGAAEGCSPCEANLARLRQVLEQQAASQGYSGTSTP